MNEDFDKAAFRPGRDSCRNLNYLVIFEAIRLILHKGFISKTTKNKEFFVNQRHFFWETIY